MRPVIATAAAADRQFASRRAGLATCQPAPRDPASSRLSYLKGKSMAEWTILCDFDGTIALDDTTDTLLERFARPGWQVLEADWRQGRIGSHDCMAGQVALL